MHTFICTDMDNLGIKLWGTDELPENDTDQLEIKRRQLDLPDVTFIQGLQDAWSIGVNGYFTANLPAPSYRPTSQLKMKPGLTFAKVRYLRRYQVTTDQRVLAVPLKEWPDNGCNTELTKLIAPGEKIWWTLGLEAFGDVSASIEDTLMLSANYFFAETKWGRLKKKDSYGYPKWLNIVIPFGVKNS